jgi:hypothetical protein
LGVQIIWEFGSRCARFGWTAEWDQLARLFDPLLCGVEVLKPRDDGLRRRRERLCGDIAIAELFLERFECRLGLGTRQLDPLLLEATLEVLLRAQREGQVAFSFAALLVERAQRGLVFLRGLPRALEFLLECRELVSRLLCFGLLSSHRGDCARAPRNLLGNDVVPTPALPYSSLPEPLPSRTVVGALRQSRPLAPTRSPGDEERLPLASRSFASPRSRTLSRDTSKEARTVPNLDLFIYRDFDTLDVELDVGDNAAERLGMDFRDLYVVAVGPPIHKGRDKTVVLASEARPEMMQEIKRFFAEPSDKPNVENT